jgi:hypothetical protein
MYNCYVKNYCGKLPTRLTSNYLSLQTANTGKQPTQANKQCKQTPQASNYKIKQL